MDGEMKVGVGVGVLIINDGGQILLGKRHDDPEKASSLLNGAGTWTMPGGKINFGETLEAGIRRETKEETGINLKFTRLISVNDDIVEKAHFVTIGFLCTEFEGTADVMEPDKITEWRWFELDKLPSPLYFPSAKIIKNYLGGSVYFTARPQPLPVRPE